MNGFNGDGNQWQQFNNKNFQEECGLCDALITAGWMELESQEMVCNEHVVPAKVILPKPPAVSA